MIPKFKCNEQRFCITLAPRIDQTLAFKIWETVCMGNGLYPGLRVCPLSSIYWLVN